VSAPIDALLGQAGLAADRAELSQSTPAAERLRLERLANEFESMLLVQVLKDMRRAGRWVEDGEEGHDASGGQSLFEMLDAELASQLSKAQGLGVAKQMLAAFDRAQGGGVGAVATSGTSAAVSVGAQVDGRHEHDGGVATGEDLAARLREGHVTSSFGWRKDPITGEARFHRGVDVRAAYGQDIPAMQAGKVVFSGNQGSYGTTVVVEHADGTRSRYAHLSVAVVHAGDVVGAGQPIGRAGNSGRATGPHLHFELLGADGVPQDPMR
jgi:murein DD-endopeptidase MepM/ murein hydrolase activator NlpD